MIYYKFFALILLLTSCGVNSIYVRDDIKTSLIDKPNLDEIENTIFLIGDAGEPTIEFTEPTFKLLEKEASINFENNLIVFLGDNVYPNGLVNSDNSERTIGEKYLQEQINIVKNSGAEGIFIPGNHDWQQGNENGLEYLTNQEDFINSLKIPNLKFLPKKGNPGPVSFFIGPKTKLIIIDTQWWLQKNPKFTNPHNLYNDINEEQIINKLETELDTAGGIKTIVVGHHPFETHGMHGGFFDWKDHIFPLTNLYSWMWIPLPIVGSSYPLLRNSVQDVTSEEYQNMVYQIENVFEKFPPVVYASGHEHVLQVIDRDRKYFQLGSGKGISAGNSVVTTDENTLFAGTNEGFMRLDILKNGKIRLGIIESLEDGNEGREIFSMWLKKENK